MVSLQVDYKSDNKKCAFKCTVCMLLKLKLGLKRRRFEFQEETQEALDMVTKDIKKCFQEWGKI